ncbi:MAG: HipA N-terminal domain-containing protein [Gemmatimonadetes bacterium]|nr:HipA N-terminal domain-containing protein [Gemmatimonadota bacterium]
MDRFDVYFDGDHTGMLDVEGRDFSFRYNRELMDSTDAIPISRSLPGRDEPFNDAECGPFFRGLLPEDQYRRSVAASLPVQVCAR